jgi:hypothetical protein
VHTHTYQYKLSTPVPDSTPPEHRPNTEDRSGAWDRLEKLIAEVDGGE